MLFCLIVTFVCSCVRVPVRVNRPMARFPQVCIHQSRIGDGLKALPVNVMACNQMLVLCGPTYPNRLWCVCIRAVSPTAEP